MRYQVATLLAVGLLCFQPACSSDTPEKAAAKRAQEWLALVDQGNYVESWDAAAKALQTSVPREKWKDLLTRLRPPLGKVRSRRVASTTYKPPFRGAPEGNYVLMMFTTSFERRDLVETVIPLQEADGTWRVSSYFIR